MVYRHTVCSHCNDDCAVTYSVVEIEGREIMHVLLNSYESKIYLNINLFTYEKDCCINHPYLYAYLYRL
jgi:hypothetical protein